MADIIPFKGILYNPDKVNGSDVMAPPYDVVTPEMKDALYEKSQCNIIRIDFGKDEDGDTESENRYTRARQFLTDWLKDGILTNDTEPGFYCYEISYTINGTQKKMRGYLGAVRIEELGKGKIHPHEMTYSKPKSDRLNILRRLQTNTSPIFSLYSSEEGRTSSLLTGVAGKRPFIESTDGNCFTHRLWKINDPASIEIIRAEMDNKDIFIADGHHRYETALAFRREMQESGLLKTGNEPFNYALMFLANMEEEGLTLLPTHRIVEIDSDINIKESLRKCFDIKKVDPAGLFEKETRRKMLEAIQKDTHSFGLFLTNSNTYYTLTYKCQDTLSDQPECLRTLDVTVLHKLIFGLLKIDHFEYEMDPDIAVERARKGSFEAAFFLNPTRVQDVKEVALAGQRMPPKSTYFYPKLLTGMVMYSF